MLIVESRFDKTVDLYYLKDNTHSGLKGSIIMTKYIVELSEWMWKRTVKYEGTVAEATMLALMNLPFIEGEPLYLAFEGATVKVDREAGGIYKPAAHCATSDLRIILDMGSRRAYWSNRAGAAPKSTELRLGSIDW